MRSWDEAYLQSGPQANANLIDGEKIPSTGITAHLSRNPMPKDAQF
jgi:hypothetical protein